MTHHDKARELVGRLDRTLGGVTVPNLMHGDNLAITLCTAYDNPDQDTDDETGWTPDAISGQEAVLSAIRAHYAPLAELITALAEENQRLREATEYDADAAKGMAKIVDLGDGAVATIIDPRSFAAGGPEWVMRYGNPCSIRFVAASLLESYDGLLSDHITTQEAVRRLRLMRNARADLRSTREDE